MGQLERVIISGGGTGGHINPALAIAEEIKTRYPDCQINFVGAKGRMEMDKVPSAGYNIEGLWISGLERKLSSIKNLSFPFKVLSSIIKAGSILKKYKPQVVIGVGGFASGPVLFRASRKGIPTLIQEQNSYPGITNRILANKVSKVCSGFPGLSRWFPKEKIIETGNPLSEGVLNLISGGDKTTGAKHFKLNDSKPIVFIMGGSLGAASINEAVKSLVESMVKNGKADYSILWQCGDRYYSENTNWLNAITTNHTWIRDCVKCLGFINRMDLAYSSADIIVSRAGAMSISELSLVAKPTILIPSPHVTEDHQTKNALSLVDRNAAIMIKDRDVAEVLVEKISRVLENAEAAKTMCSELKKTASPNACKVIVDEIEKLISNKS